MYLTVFSSQYNSFPINNINVLLLYVSYVCFKGPRIFYYKQFVGLPKLKKIKLLLF